MKRILVCEDEDVIRDCVVINLKRAGYDVVDVNNGEAALQKFDDENGNFDIVLLDIMMPGIDGISLVRRMRDAQMATPVLLLTARDAITDRVEGLNAGADDYLVKPFAFEELSARLRVLTRRNRHMTNQFQLADLTVDADSRTARRGGALIPLSSREYALLEYLIRNKGRVLSRSQIEEHVWSYDYEGASNMVDVYIRNLRKKIDEGHAQKLIHTVRYAGYVLREEA